eukprot:scaffold74326_cov20-Tisochrysis_lutea.AAC.1
MCAALGLPPYSWALRNCQAHHLYFSFTTGAARVPRTAGTRAPRPPPAYQEKADALLDEKQLKRKQSNRDSARRSRLRKQ